MAEGLGTTTKDVLDAFLALKDQPLTSANTRAALYRLEEELIRQNWNIMAHYDSQFYLTSSMIQAYTDNNGGIFVLFSYNSKTKRLEVKEVRGTAGMIVCLVHQGVKFDALIPRICHEESLDLCLTSLVKRYHIEAKQIGNNRDMSDDNESSEDHVDDSSSSEDDSLNPDDRSVISVDIDDDDYEDLTKSALNSLLQPIDFDSLSPT